MHDWAGVFTVKIWVLQGIIASLHRYLHFRPARIRNLQQFFLQTVETELRVVDKHLQDCVFVSGGKQDFVGDSGQHAFIG